MYKNMSVNLLMANSYSFIHYSIQTFVILAFLYKQTEGIEI